MKILMVNKFLYPRGGAETYFLKIGALLIEQGHEVEYFGMLDKKNTVGNSAQAYTYNMDFHAGGLQRFIYPFKIVYSLEAKRKIRSVIQSFRPDIIHLNNINFQLTPSIIEEAARHGVPIIQTVHDYQMLCPNHLLFDAVTHAPCERCIHGSKWNCARRKCIHGSRAKGILGSVEAILYRMLGTYKKVSLYICPSSFMEQKLLEIPLYRGKTVAIHNFIDLPAGTPVVEKCNYVLYFGRLSEEKGLDMLLDCSRRLPDIPFVVAGSGPMEDACKGIPNVDFVGFKTGRALDELVGQALFSVYPSIWYDNCPLSILESESLGTPVLATSMGGIPELVEDGKTGALLETISPSALETQIRRLYGNRTLLQQMSANCLEKRARMITLPEYCERLLQCYGDVLQTR